MTTQFFREGNVSSRASAKGVCGTGRVEEGKPWHCPFGQAELDNAEARVAWSLSCLGLSAIKQTCHSIPGACSYYQAATRGANFLEIQSARSKQRVSSIDWRPIDRESGPSFQAGKDKAHARREQGDVPCTIKDVARLAGVSIATVSRVTSGSNVVSGKTAAKVLAAVSQLQYSPNALAAELARANLGNPRKREARRPKLVGKKATLLPGPGLASGVPLSMEAGLPCCDEISGSCGVSSYGLVMQRRMA
jgi:transcriptional regulator with XRE-family HTH domain